MFLSLETDSNIASFKMKAIELSLGQKLPHKAAEKLKELLKKDNLPVEEFLAEYNKILASTETLSWKTIVYLSNLKARFIDQVVRISPFQIGFVLLLFLVLFLFYKKYTGRSKKRKKYVFSIIKNVLERFYALFAYVLPIIQCYAFYVSRLLPFYPLLYKVYPPFMDIAVQLFSMKVEVIGWTYFFIVVYISLRRRIPRSRFVRFHIARGLVLANFQTVPESLVNLITGPTYTLPQEQQIILLMVFLILNIYFILPSLIQALGHTYPKNPFIREATEVILGRDKDPGFKWWDRDY